jgi:inner membrane protein
MPTILSHPAVPLAIGLGLGTRVIPPRLLVAGVLASIVPDFDVVGFGFGIAYADAAGHRGLSHSIAFAALLGALALIGARTLRAPPWVCFVFVFVAALSHGLLDMLTNGGLGVALWWPLSEERLFFPVQPIQVSPLGIRVFSSAGLRVFESEALWVLLPGLLVFALLRWRKSKSAP